MWRFVFLVAFFFGRRQFSTLVANFLATMESGTFFVHQVDLGIGHPLKAKDPPGLFSRARALAASSTNPVLVLTGQRQAPKVIERHLHSAAAREQYNPRSTFGDFKVSHGIYRESKGSPFPSSTKATIGFSSPLRDDDVTFLRISQFLKGRHNGDWVEKEGSQRLAADHSCPVWVRLHGPVRFRGEEAIASLKEAE